MVDYLLRKNYLKLILRSSTSSDGNFNILPLLQATVYQQVVSKNHLPSFSRGGD